MSSWKHPQRTVGGAAWPALMVTAALAIMLLAPVVALAQQKQEFGLDSFKALANQIPLVVGEPLGDPDFQGNDRPQRTTRGLMVQRLFDGRTAFTDGSHTWVAGPYGLQDRNNGDWFNWEYGARPASYARAWTILGGRPDASRPFNLPYAAAVDSHANVYVADTWNHRVVKLGPDGQVLAIWGVRKGDAPGQFDAPTGIAVDLDDNVYLDDTNNQRIQKLTPWGEVVAIWYPLGPPRGPWGYQHESSIATDAAGNLYLLDGPAVRKISPDGNVVARWGESGKNPGQFGAYPYGSTLGPWAHRLTADATGNVYVADTYNRRIQKFTSTGTLLRIIELDWEPWGVAVDGEGNLYVSGNGITKLSPIGEVLDRWSSTGGHVMTVDQHGFLWVTGRHEGELRILKLSLSGRVLAEYGPPGVAPGQMDGPMGVAVDPAGNVYVADAPANRIRKLSPSGSTLAEWGSPGSGPEELNWPSGIALDADGNLYVAEKGNHRIQKFSSAGQPLARWGRYGGGPGEFSGPTGVAVDAKGYIYVADRDNHRIQKLSPAGEPLAQLGRWGTAPGEFEFPQGVAVDAEGNVYVAGAGAYMVQKLSPTGRPMALWGKRSAPGAGAGSAMGLAIDAEGDIWVTGDQSAVRRFSQAGRLVEAWGPIGPGDRPFQHPNGIAVDGAGNVYVADAEAHRVVKVSPPPRP